MIQTLPHEFWTSKKSPFTTPEGKVLIRAYVGKPGDTVVDDHTDNELVSIVRRDLSQMMTFKGDPEFTIVKIRLPKKYATVPCRSYSTN